MNKPFAIFDMDGTLIDSMPFWRDLSKDFLGSKGITVLPPDLGEVLKTMTMRDSAVYFTETLGVAGTPEQANEEMTAIMETHYRAHIPLKPGVRDYLEVLRQRGVRMCVASATPTPLADACLRRLEVRDWFEFLLSCDDVGAGKRSPAIFLEAARRLRAAPGDTMVFEDALHAARTAQDAGFPVAAVYDAGTGDDWPDLEALAEETIRDWTVSARVERERDRI